MGATYANSVSRVYNATHIAFSTMRWEGDEFDRQVYVNPMYALWLGIRIFICFGL